MCCLSVHYLEGGSLRSQHILDALVVLNKSVLFGAIDVKQHGKGRKVYERSMGISAEYSYSGNAC